MGTICKIAYQNNNSVDCITCYNDGAIESVGKMLSEIYNTKKYVSMIINRGNLAKLGTNLKKFDKEKNVNGTVDNYQWKGKKIPKKSYKDISGIVEDEREAQYIYYFKDEIWYAMKVLEDDGELKPYLSEFYELNSLFS